MNVDVINCENFRLTSHGGRAFDLYNRDTNEVHKITKGDYEYIKYGLSSQGPAECQNMIDRCHVVDRLYSSIFPGSAAR